MLYWCQGKYVATEPLFLEGLEKRKAVLGESHPDNTLESMNFLALLYYSQGKYDLAEPLYLESLRKRTESSPGRQPP